MIKKEAVRQYPRTRSMLILLMMMLMTSLVCVSGCETGYYEVDVAGICTSDTCFGVCENENTCCLEDCVPDDEFIESSTECGTRVNVSQTDDDVCSDIVVIVECMAGLYNMTHKLDVCYRDTVNYINRQTSGSHDFLSCPCGSGYERVVGTCYMDITQCTNDTCISKYDIYVSEQVCCLKHSIFPKDVCRKNAKLVTFLNVSTVEECSEICGRSCIQSDPTVLPACCSESPKTKSEPKPDGGGGLNGAVIAVMIVFISMVLIVISIGAVYLFRTKINKALVKNGDTPNGQGVSVDLFDSLSTETIEDRQNGINNTEYKDDAHGAYAVSSIISDAHAYDDIMDDVNIECESRVNSTMPSDKVVTEDEDTNYVFGDGTHDYDELECEDTV